MTEGKIHKHSTNAFGKNLNEHIPILNFSFDSQLDSSNVLKIVQ